MEGPSIERLAALVVAQLPATSEPEAAATSAPTRPGAALSPPLLRRAADGEAPLSAPQERLLRLHAAGRAAPLPLLLQVEGALDVSALERAWAALVRRHDLLRTRFDGGRQLVDAGAAATLATAAFDGVPADLRAAAFRRRLAEECARPFDPSRGPLLRATLLRAGQDQHALLVAAHPLVFDEPSRAILTSELARAYDAALAGAEADLAPLPLQFGDYAAWQRAWLGGGEPGVGDGAPAPAYEALSVPLGVDAAATLGALAQEHGLDERVPWLACLLAALPATREAPPVRLGLSSANRARVGTEELIGPLAGFVAVPADLGGGPTFLQMLERLREALAGALRDEDRPWELRAGRDDAFPGLDRLAASLAFERALTPRAGDVRWRPLACETRLEAGGGRPRAALELALRQDENGTQATLLFAPRRVDQEQAEALARGLARAVERATAEPGRRLAELTETPLSVEAGRA